MLFLGTWVLCEDCIVCTKGSVGIVYLDRMDETKRQCMNAAMTLEHVAQANSE
jgi:hypothetical protein